MAPPRKEPDLDAILQAFVYLYSESRRVTRAVADQYGLTGSQLLVLKVLEAEQGTSLSELSERLRAKNSTVTGIVDRMERDGIVTRTRSETDRRVVNLALTSRGKKLAAGAQMDPMQLFRALLQDLDVNDALELERIMGKLAGRVRELFDEAPSTTAADPVPVPSENGSADAPGAQRRAPTRSAKGADAARGDARDLPPPRVTRLIQGVRGKAT